MIAPGFKIRNKKSEIHRGFAVIAVLWVLAILTAVAMALVASVRVEVRVASAEREALLAERLARSGQEVAAYLATRGLGSSLEDLRGLPVDVVVPGFHYRVRFPNGVVELYLEADSGKINLATAPLPLLVNFFTRWTGDPAEGLRLASAIGDWRDRDSEPRPDGAEAESYAALGYTPRNTGVGFADVPLIRGLGFVDFRARVVGGSNALAVLEGFSAFVTSAPAGATVNPNFAPPLVLRSVPGLTDELADAILAARKHSFFRDADELRSQVPIPSDSEAWPYLTFARGNAPAVLAIARPAGSRIRRSERRIDYLVVRMNPVSGNFDTRVFLGKIERNVFSGFAQP